jgi:hypothetical protein
MANYLEGTKTVAKVAAVAVDGGSYTHEIDTYGADYVSVDVVYSTFTATSTAYASVLKVQQSDVAGSGQTDVPGLTVTATAGRTTGTHVARFNVDMRGKKRYITVVGNPAKPATVASVARLSKLEDEPYDATTAGVSNYVSG